MGGRGRRNRRTGWDPNTRVGVKGVVIKGLVRAAMSGVGARRAGFMWILDGVLREENLVVDLEISGGICEIVDRW